MQLPVLESILILLVSVIFIAMLFRRLNLPPVIGYLIIGATAGPYGLGLMPDKHAISALAEFGIVFLMFTIGLEFSLSKMLSMKKSVWVLGSLQVIVTTLLTMGIGLIMNAHLAMSFVVGGLLAMSSTAIVSKQLRDQVELNSTHGNNAISVLLFQDVAVILFLIITPTLANKTYNVLVPLLLAILKTGLVMFIIVFLGRKVLRPLFFQIAASRSLEIFTLAVLLITLSSAWLTSRLGLSAALGAFMAGMMLGETEFRHQIEVEIRPFRDILLGLFFISIGMLLNISTIPEAIYGIIVLLTILILVKASIIFALCRLLKNPIPTAIRTGLVLAQGGEFSFALLSAAMNENLFPQHYQQMILCALLLSMAISPFIIRYNKQISHYLLSKNKPKQDETLDNVSNSAMGLMNHVIIVGYGRVGQNIAQFLEKEGFEFLALDLDANRVKKAQLAGERVSYGDATNMSILQAAGIEHAKAMIFSIAQPKIAIKSIQQIRQKLNHQLPILVRTRDDSYLDELQSVGATEVVPESLEASLMLVFHALVLMDIPAFRAFHHLRTARADRYQLLNRVYSNEEISIFNMPQSNAQLDVIPIPENAACINKKLSQFIDRQNNITITAIKRNGIRVPDPGPETELQANDILVLFGLPDDIEQLKIRLLT